LQGVGIDPYVGYLHTDRPGRLSLALDMLEELRPWWCDRFVLTLINRKQIKAADFVYESSGAVRLTDDARKAFLSQWQARKQEELEHPYTGERIQIGLLPHVQASLLAKYLREDLECYPPFLAH
ncbi:MAG: CRISPR-associated endonuclease Cas1, partial [Methylococcales bacterium]